MAPDAAVDAVTGASRALTRLVETNADAVDVLADLDAPVERGERDLAAWYRLEYLRIAARDLTGLDDLRATGAALSALAAETFAAACATAGADGLAVIGMGKCGGSELNYASDVDVVFVGDGGSGGDERVARAVADLVRPCFRIDLNLRPEGRDGALVRTVESYAAYWDRWAQPWEFQALLKARPIAGDTAIGAAWYEAASRRLWQAPFTAEEIRSVRAMKARAEAEVARRGLQEREVKTGTGGIRDVEFAVQLLQLVHGADDPQLRTPNTLSALDELADGGYVDRHDADTLADAYRFLRLVEHRLQLDEGQQVHTVPRDPAALDRLARAAGFSSTPEAGAGEQLAARLREVRHAARAVHERLWFRPLLEAFGSDGRTLAGEAGATRLAAFGFSDAERTRQAVTELTRGLTRSSRLMQQLLPLVLYWLSAAPNPDAGLLGLRRLATGGQRSTALAAAFRDSAEVARRLCVVLGTGPWFADVLHRNPDLVPALGDDVRLAPPSRQDLAAGARGAVAVRDDVDARRASLKRFTDRAGVMVGAADVLGHVDTSTVGTALTDLAESAIDAALVAADARDHPPFAVVAMGRFGGGELSYASDLDLLFAYDGSGPGDFEAAERTALALTQFVGQGTPHVYDVDPGLRPEGRQGALARSLEGFATYTERWAQPWERLAWVRARPIAGDPEVGRRFLAVIEPFVWGGPVSEAERREIRRLKARTEHERIPTDEDPDFHLKLGRGSLADVEFTTQLLQLEHGVRAVGTREALGALLAEGALDATDHEQLAAAHAFCEAARNRLFLVRGTPSDSLPQQPEWLERLATSLGTNAHDLRDDYRRVTRRARAVVERLFYGRG